MRDGIMGQKTLVFAVYVEHFRRSDSVNDLNSEGATQLVEICTAHTILGIWYLKMTNPELTRPQSPFGLDFG